MTYVLKIGRVLLHRYIEHVAERIFEKVKAKIQS